MASEKTGEEQLKAVWFAAGTAAFMACVQRAVVVSLFAHWRVWAFLALNLVLLAILFTSKYQTTPPSDEVERDEDTTTSSSKKNKKGQECGVVVTTSNDSDECGKVKQPTQVENVENEKNIVEVDGGKQETQDQLSKEELNKRVEAFIAMFRQHLVTDARIENRYRSKRSSRSGFVMQNQLNSPSRASFSL